MKNYRIISEKTQVTVKKVRLNNNLGFISNSDFESMFYEFWKAINGGKASELKGIKEQLSVLKNLVSSHQDLYMVSFENSLFGQKEYLINKESFLEITSSWIIFELGSDKIQSIQLPYEDYINEFIEEVLLLFTSSARMN
jgi:hypothetical protein